MSFSPDQFACGGYIPPTAYSVDYFINFFDSIPEARWMTGSWHNEDKTQFCAMGHLGSDSSRGATREARDLGYILGCNPASINDGKNKYYQQAHPKHRIMAALFDVRKYGKAQYDPEIQDIVNIYPPVTYKKNYFDELYGSFDYGKITFNDLPKFEIKEVVKEVIKEVVVEKIVYVTVDKEVRELQQEQLIEN